jgi:alkanesulfonate monooxygenase SsuD/methylene tetrahydromethanopterin reductase-like flavin-dependent oxidoreductase (luciferase family)
VNVLNAGIRFGVAVLQDMPWPRLVELWQLLDVLEFDSAWIADHFVNYTNPNASWLEAWTTLSGLASITSRIRIGTLVTSIALRHPAVLARQAMTVDNISNGRLNLGIGAGASGAIDPTYRMTGINDWPVEERVKRFREQVEMLNLLLTNRISTYSGEYYTLQDAAMFPGPVQKPRPPLTIAAHGKQSLKIAAEYADTWNSYGADFGAPAEVVIEKTNQRIAFLDRFCERIGRDPTTLGKSLLVFGEEANSVFASEENFVKTVERYTTIGITELIFYYPFFAPNQIDSFKRIGQEILPQLRKA